MFDRVLNNPQYKACKVFWCGLQQSSDFDEGTSGNFHEII